MSKCKYCGLTAGFLKSAHKECANIYEAGKIQFLTEVQNAIVDGLDFNELDVRLRMITGNTHIQDNEITDLMVNGFDKAVDSVLDADTLTIENDERIALFKSHYNYDQNTIDKHGSLEKIVKASIIRNISAGTFTEPRINLDANLPFIIGKDEILVWLFKQSYLYENVTHTEYRGGSHGMSVRVAKGLYYRTSSFKGRPIKITETKITAIGLVGLTNKHLYFSSSTKTFKIPYQKIIRIDPYSDGIGIQKDGTSSKPLLIKGIDGWFTYNVIVHYLNL